MLKCVLLSLVLLLGVTTPLPMDSESDPSLELAIADTEYDTTTEQGDTPEETTHSQLAEDDEETEDNLDLEDVELSTSSAEKFEEHIFLTEDDSEENMLISNEENTEENIVERKLEDPDPKKCSQSKTQIFNEKY